MIAELIVQIVVRARFQILIVWMVAPLAAVRLKFEFRRRAFTANCCVLSGTAFNEDWNLYLCSDGGFTLGSTEVGMSNETFRIGTWRYQVQL